MLYLIMSAQILYVVKKPLLIRSIVSSAKGNDAPVPWQIMQMHQARLCWKIRDGDLKTLHSFGNTV